MSYYLLGEHGGMRVVLRVSAQGEGEAQNAAYDAIAAWKPQAIIAVGIAFGVNPQKQAIGDVLVAENVRGYELGRQEPNGTFTLRSNKPPTSPALQQRFRHLDQGKQADANACRTWLKLRFGTLLSGNKLVDNRDYRDDLRRIEPEAIGGEMEAVGIQLAADRHKTDWIVVKAICDWGDGNKHGPHKERDQCIAAEHAAYVVHSALSLGSLYAPLSTTPASRSTSPARHAARLPPARSMGLRDYSAIDDERLIDDALGRHTSMEKDAVAAADEQGSDVDAMDFVLRWVDERESPPLFALLGEYGMGKTVTCQRLAHVLDQRRMRDTTLPLPLYFDLRNVTGLDRRVPTLGEIVEECIARGWDLPESGETYRYADFERWLEAGAVVIFDGLDEALNRLTEADGQTFTRELLRPLTRQHEASRARCTFKRLISCRTQFFRTLREQQNHFTGQERGEQRAAAYRALVLLPLDEEQVQHYLAAALPGSDVEQLLATVRSVHNLSELAQRPYTLRLVAEFIPEIEHERLAGKKVYGVTLYRRLVRRWLERDGGKHHLRPEHKLLLARHLAAYLWQSGDGGLPAEQIERWFHAWLAGQPDLQRRYARLHPDQLEEDLRNATFLARIDGSGGSVFRFAHTSLLEFFLADYLFAAIVDDDRQRWAIRRPSDETLAFLGQMLAEALDTTQPALLATLHAWRSSYLPQTSELLLAYALRAHEHGWPAPSLRGVVLAGAPLDGWRFVSPGAGSTLDLGGADFSGASLRRAVFDRVCLTGARFVGCQLAQANFLGCDANGSDWSAAECTATIWRATPLNGAQWRAAHGYRPEFLLCDVTPTADSGAAFEQAQSAPFPAAPAFPLREADASRASYALRYLRGHAGGVSACAWSPDGQRLLSGGDDGTLRVWDAPSGTELWTLRGHDGWVRACAWSPDGQRLLSGGDDG
ncbi:MAG TPA: NACHT domain-containing protein, partial [Accumulibacter sp.]|nr:NACHT domain-containing protein [Accumulibacter sp.]